MMEVVMKAGLFKLLFFVSLIITFSPLNALCGVFRSNLTDEEALRLLKGEEVFQLFVSLDEELSDNLSERIEDSIDLKLKSIGKDLVRDLILGEPYLSVSVNVLKSASNTYNGSIELSFRDEIFFKKEGIAGYAPVWNSSGVFTSFSEDDIKEKADNLFDRFLNVYLEANPIN
jgi:hypothetical protein